MSDLKSVPVNWESDESQFFLNPRFSLAEAEKLLSLLNQTGKDLKRHIFLLSSGTSGKSVSHLKWIALSKDAFLASAAAVNQHFKSDHQDVWIHSLPDFHVGGLSIWARSYLSGARVVHLPKWDPKQFVDLVQAEKGTLSSLVPAQVYDLVAQRLNCPPSVRAIAVGGGALSPSLYQYARHLGWPVLPSYGMTETCSMIACAPLENHTRFVDLNSRHLPLLKILNHAEVQTGSNRGKTFVIKAKSLLTAYLCRGRRFPVINDPKVNGWFTTEDRGVLKPDGFLAVFGRGTDFIKIGGESVELGRLKQVLENVKLRLNLASDFDLLPVPDERLGHVIFLISDKNLVNEDGQALVEEFNRSVLPFEKIRKWEVLDQIPRTALGKLIPKACYSLLSLK